MNHIRLFSLFFMLLIFPFMTSTHQDTEKRGQKQPIAHHFPDFFFTPLSFSEKSLTFFLKKIFNDKKYPQYFLAHNFTHIIDGVNFAHESLQPRFTIGEILSLFQSKFTNIYINPYAFSYLLAQMHPTIARYCNKHQEKIYTLASIKECVGSYILDNYPLLQQNPEKALNDLSHELYTLTVEPQEEEGDSTIRELQHAVYHFLACGLSQLIWNPTDQIDTWHNVKLLSCQLEKFSEYYIIDTKMLNSLLWVLLNRYSYFISLVARELKPSFFKEIRADLQSEKAALWCSESEKELYITTKLEHLTSALLEAEIAAEFDARIR